jgi:hypothetical protein
LASNAVSVGNKYEVVKVVLPNFYRNATLMILPERMKESYQLIEEGGGYYVEILDAVSFWEIDLVILGIKN